nr:hypothetical protein [Candidatus Omnitrophota bacterium]
VNKTKSTGVRKLLKTITFQLEEALEKIEKLEKCIEKADAVKTKEAMFSLRETIDVLEGLIPEDVWPLPSYAQMLFML